MNIIPQRKEKKAEKQFELSFFLNNATGSEFLDFNLPIPNYLYHTAQGHIVIMWLINGYFGTAKSQEFLNDIIARFILSFSEYKPKRTKIFEKRENGIVASKNAHELKEFQGLKSIRKAKKVAERANLTGTKDQVFYALKFYAEELIKETSICAFNDLYDFALDNFEYKDKSTLKAKCRSIINWYAERDFKIGRSKQKYNNQKQYLEETEMTRIENMIRVNKRRAENKEALIIGLTTGLFCNEYKKKNGKWNYKKIGLELDINQETVSKYLKK